MTVLIAKEPKKIYQSIGSLSSTEQDLTKADKLDRRLEQRMRRLLKELNSEGLMPQKSGGGSVATYRELGKALHDVADNSELLNRAELPLFWLNAKIYLPEQLKYKKRGPYREHLWYCYRLASYPTETAGKINWSEWVTIFDSAGINQETRFDAWFLQKLYHEKEHPGRSLIRTFAVCVNTMLGKIYTRDLAEGELFPCYAAAWELSREWHALLQDKKEHKFGTKDIKNSITCNLGLLSEVMGNAIKSKEYARKIVSFMNNQSTTNL